MMHGAKAALESRQISPTSHRGLRNQFGLHLVRTGLIEAGWSVRIADSFRARLSADYDATAVFDETNAREACETAAAFLDRIRLLLPPELAADKPAACP